MAQIGGGVRFTDEMNIFNDQIAGEKQVFGRAARAIDCAVVADSKSDRGSGWDARRLPQLLGDRTFVEQIEV